MISKLRNNCEMISKLQNGYEMISKLQNGCKMISKLQNGLRKCFFFPFGCKMGRENVSFFPFCCEMASKLRNGYEMAFRLQKLTCERKGGLRKHLAKPTEVAKMPIEPRNHASKEESLLTKITHTKPLTPFLTSLNH